MLQKFITLCLTIGCSFSWANPKHQAGYASAWIQNDPELQFVQFLNQRSLPSGDEVSFLHWTYSFLRKSLAELMFRFAKPDYGKGLVTECAELVYVSDTHISSAPSMSEASKKQIQMVPGRYQVFPGEIYPTNGEYFDLRNQRVFAFYSSLVSQEFLSKHKEDNHVPFATSFLRYQVDRKRSRVLVLELQSDLVAQMSEPLRKAHRHWHRQTLLAFILWIKRNHPSLKSIVVPGADYIKRRWEVGEDAPSAALLKPIYERTPRWLGFRPAYLEGAGEVNEYRAFVQEDDSPEMLGEASELDLTSASIADLLSGLFSPTDLENWRPKQLRDDGLTTPEPPVDFEYLSGVRAEPIQPFQLYEDLPTELIAAQQRLRLKYLPLLPSPGLLEQGYIRLIPESAIHDGHFSTSVGVYHSGFQNRHPRINFESERGLISLGIKGAGAMTKHLESGSEAALASQPFALNREVRPSEMSHYVWGGLLREEAVVEWTNTLALHALSLKEFNHPAAAAVPLAINRLTELAVIHEDTVERLSPKTYFKRFFPKTHRHMSLYQLISATRSPFRSADIILAIISPQPNDSAQVLRQMLSHLWIAYSGSTNEEIEKLFDEEEVKVLDTPEKRVAWLQSFYLRHASTHDQIRKKLFAEVLKTVGLVHRYGGHFGGTVSCVVAGDDGEPCLVLGSEGAINGGSLHPRNFAITGEILDLDFNVAMPGAPDELVRRISKSQLEYNQRIDLLYLQAALYWVDILLRGREPEQASKLEFYPFGDPGYEGVILVEVGGYDPREEAKTRALLVDPFQAKPSSDGQILKQDDLESVYRGL